MSHTPEPWSVDMNYFDETKPNFLVDEEEETILMIWGPDGEGFGRICHAYDETGGNLLANALLIAAAPELLEALEALLDGRPTKEPPNEFGIAHRNWLLFEKGRKAIAKAKGE